MEPEISFQAADADYTIGLTKKVARWIVNTVKAEHLEPGHIAFVWCSDEYLHRMNVEYLGHDTLTDVITFDYAEQDLVSGDIFISTDRIQENAQAYGVPFEQELHRVMVHGVLHLCGYQDKKPEQKAEMTEKEDYYLSLRDF